MEKKHLKFFAFLGVLAVSEALWAYDLKTEPQVSPNKPVSILASELTFDRLNGLTIFKGNVRASHGQVLLTADEVRALSGNREATAEGRVKVEDPTVPMGLSCGNLDYQDLMNLMTAHDNPVLNSLDEDGRPVTVEGRQMELDAQKKIVRIHQDVKITHDSGKAEAGRATYLAKEDKFILEESPRLSIRNGWLSGRRIVTKLGGERSVIVEGNAEGLFNPSGGPIVEPDKKPSKIPGEKVSAVPVAGSSPTPIPTPSPTPKRSSSGFHWN